MQAQAEDAVRIGGDNRILEIVRILVALIAKVEPGLRILVDKQRSERANVTQAVVVKNGPFPGKPGTFVEWMLG
jgi:hypothetical protein